nr:MAG TPA: hypothetical protein [Caudoviricetes sp.]
MRMKVGIVSFVGICKAINSRSDKADMRPNK